MRNGLFQGLAAEKVEESKNGHEQRREESLSAPVVAKTGKAPVFQLGFGELASEAIYQAYPRHIAKKPALRAIEKALGDLSQWPRMTAPSDWLLGRVVDYAKTRQGQDP